MSERGELCVPQTSDVKTADDEGETIFFCTKKKTKHDFCQCVFEDLSLVQKKAVILPPADLPQS